VNYAADASYGVSVGFEVPIHSDSLLSKLIAWGATREEARQRMLRALGEYRVGGVRTTLPFFQWMLRHDAFIRGDVDTTFLDKELAERRGVPFAPPDASQVHLALVGTALDVWFAATARETAGGDGVAASAWARAARQSALRR
jgi:acetyl-CoA carboxylase biotin carboxylase subunit